MLSKGMLSKGHEVEILTAKPVFYKLPVPKALKKWMGYIDQYLIFPAKFKRKIKKSGPDTLYVFTDHALGPWVPLVAGKKHVVHCHDFLAQKSALSQFPQNKTGWTGRKYQAFIRRGYSKARNFISVSKKTQADLHEFLGRVPDVSEVVYNGLNQAFTVRDDTVCRQILKQKTGLNLDDGYILHVGGNQWYKNRAGVINIYDAWRDQSNIKLPLVLIGQPAAQPILDACSSSRYQNDIHLLSGIEDGLIGVAYSGATVMLFPSIAEGFGWPIVEAMASGCPVITTDAAPMTEVAGQAGYLIPVMPYNKDMQDAWAINAARVLEDVVTLPAAERKKTIDAGIVNAARFAKNTALDNIERIYKVIENFEVKK
ncbi:glycosyltransferase family 1 protein [Mucilaginibacter sp. PPCGB 2223]|uniref:glycosyltransferase family 4 protein n=1 Tax=Mucilaginibacter sp. PPCGB 2223 TaxID=1886027 RepID=UPI0020C82F6A|nr:glycosyltransferase family 1 protein [Mucilaginibacter sp. PPCGB 2223]